jgi:hypothetical protein
MYMSDHSGNPCRRRAFVFELSFIAKRQSNTKPLAVKFPHVMPSAQPPNEVEPEI